MKILPCIILIFLQVHLSAQPKDSLLLESYYEKGDRFLYTGQYDSALAYYKKVEPLSLRMGYDQIYIECLQSQMFTLFSDSRILEVRQIIPKWIQEANDRLAPSNPTFLGIYTTLAGFETKDQNIKKREFYLQKAQNWLAEHEHTDEEKAVFANLLLNMGALTLESGDFHQSIIYTKRGLDELYPLRYMLDFEPELVIIAGNANHNLSVAYRGLKDYDSSLTYAKEASRILRQFKAEDLAKVSVIQIGLAFAYYYHGDIDSAIHLSQKILQTLPSLSSERIQSLHKAELTHLLGLCYTKVEDFDKAEGTLKQAIALQKQNFSTYFDQQRHADIGASYYWLADVNRKQNDHKQALQYYQEGLIQHCYVFSDLDPQINPPLEDIRIVSSYHFLLLRDKAETQLQLAKRSTKIVDFESALSTYQLLIALIERDRQRYQTDQSRLFVMNHMFPAFDGVMWILWNLYTQTLSQEYIDLAFQFTEKSKAVILSTELMRSEAQITSAIPDSVLQTEKALKKNSAEYKAQLIQLMQKSPINDSLLRIYRKKELEVNQELDNLENSLQDTYPLYHELQSAQEIKELVDIQSSLSDRNSGLIEFFWGNRYTYALAVNANSSHFIRLDTADVHREVLSEVLAYFHQRPEGQQEVHRRLFDLYQWLLRPSITEIPTCDHLIIIPDGPLGYLPFEVLLAVPPDNLPQYLLEKYPISYANSASLLFREVSRPKASLPFAGYGPSYEGKLKLPYTETEVQMLQSMIGGQAFIGRQATEKRFRETGLSAKILHFAMHGFPNAEYPSQSSLLFQSDPDIDEDGHLYAYELYNLNLAAELAVLSACHTGYGPFAKGEGIRSLAHAFQYAGCPSVVMSLWEANGLVAKDLMPLFYNHLKEGLPKDISLQQAKLDFLATSPVHLHDPRLWANFVLIGNTEEIDQKEYFELAMWIILGFVILGFIWRITSKNLKN